MNRRDFLAGACLAGTATSPLSIAAGHSDFRTTRVARTFLFIHGAWHAAAHWNKVIILLSQMGHRAIAVDLPGSGLTARYPKSYLQNDWNAFPNESSPARDIGLDDYLDAVLPVLEGLVQRGNKVTLVGHSFGGMTITLAGERMPTAIHRLIYVTAFCPTNQVAGSAAQCNSLPENATSKTGAVLIGHPDKTGALRLNPRSGDDAYLERGRQAFYNDVPFEEFVKYSAYLNPDLSVKAASQDARGTPARWGVIPRTFIRCTEDQAIPIGLQDRMINEANDFTPSNRFLVETLPSSHSPFASMPEKLARILHDAP